MKVNKNTLIALLLLAFNLSIVAQEFNWAKRAGGNDSDDAYGIAVDEVGNNYITGYFKNTAHFGEGASQVSLTSVGGADIYIAKYNTYGELIWINQAGGADGFDWSTDITIDNDNNLIITGFFDTQVTFGEGSSAVTLTASGDNRDIYIAKYSNSGDFLWAYGAGGDENDTGSELTVDDENNFYLVGNFKGSATFGEEGNFTTIVAQGGSEDQDGFLAKYTTNGSLVWVHDYGMESQDGLSDVQLDLFDNIHVTGYRLTGSVSYFDPHIAKFDNNGNLLWADTPTGISNDGVTDFVIDQNGNSYIIGYFTIDLVFGDITILAGNDLDLTNSYLAKYSPDGDIIWAKSILGTGGPTPYGGNLGDEGRSLTIDAFGYLYITGYMCGTTTFGNDCHTTNLTSVDYKDIYLAKLNGNGNLQWALVTGGANEQSPSEIALSDQNIIFCGHYQTSAEIGSTYLNGYGGFSDILMVSILNSQETSSDYVTDLTASITNWVGNASDILVDFKKAYNEETVNEYRVFIVKAAGADDFDIETANTITHYTTIIPDGSDIYSINPNDNALDTDGDVVAEGDSYNIFVISVADGTISQANSLSCKSNKITIMYTDIADISNTNISIYPNPSSGIFTINIDASNKYYDVIISDITGSVIHSYTNTKNKVLINISNKPKGIYLIKILEKNEVIKTTKITKL